MFDVLIREAAVRFGLGDKALPLLQMLLAYMSNKETGGLPGFLDKFKSAGLGPVVQSWLGGGPSAQAITNSQLETVLGSSGGLLSQLTSRLDVSRDNITSALGYLIPAIVGKLTPGGSMPSALPAEVTSLAAAGQGLLSAPAAAEAAGAGAGGLMKWLPWVVVAVLALLGLSYCGKNRTADAPTAPAPAIEAPASEPGAETPTEPATEPAAESASEPGAADSATQAAPMASEPEPVSTQPAESTQEPAPAASDAAAPTAADTAAAAAAASDVPEGAGVVSLQGDNGLPALKVYFDSAKTDVHADFAAKAADLLQYLQSHAEAKAVISGFNDPTGNAAANAELSKQRAQAVQAALVAQGLAEDRTVLEKPADTTGDAATLAGARRVEVVVRP